MKNVICAAIFASGIILAGCQASEPEGTVVSGPKDGKRFKIGVSIPAADHGWTAGVKYWAEEAAKLHPDVDWIIEDAKSPDEQITDLENIQSQGVDALVILAVESAPITPIAKRLKEAGIFIVNVDRGFTEPVADIFVEGDNKAFGRKAAQFIVQKLNGQGNVVILEGIPSTVNTDRVQAALEVFRTQPGIRIVAQGSGEWNREKAEQMMQNILSANPLIDAIWAADDDMALGVETALKAAGRDKNVWIVGGGGMKDVVKRVMDGDPLYPATITYPPSMIAVGMQMAAGTLKTGRENVLKFMPSHMMIDVELVTPENAQRFYFPESVY